MTMNCEYCQTSHEATNCPNCGAPIRNRSQDDSKNNVCQTYRIAHAIELAFYTGITPPHEL